MPKINSLFLHFLYISFLPVFVYFTVNTAGLAIMSVNDPHFLKNALISLSCLIYILVVKHITGKHSI